MPTINVAPVVMSDGTAITQYNDTVKGTQTFTFLTEQEAFTLKNKGTKDISYTVNAHTGTLVPSQSVSFTEAITSFTLTTVSGTQAFEVRSDQAGTSGVSNLAIASLDTKVTNLTTSLADKAKKMGANVLEYGAVSSTVVYDATNKVYNMTDCTEAFQNAINSSYNIIIIPEGDYFINSQVNITKKVLIIGYNARIYSNPIPSGSSKRIFSLGVNATGTEIRGLSFYSKNEYASTLDVGASTLISNIIALDINGANNLTVRYCYGEGLSFMISAMNCTNIELDYLTSSECYFPFYSGFNASYITIKNSHLKARTNADIYGHVLYLGYGSHYITVEDCWLEMPGSGSNIVKVGSSTNDGISDHIVLKNCKLTGIATTTVLYVHAGSDISLYNCNLDFTSGPSGYARLLQFNDNSSAYFKGCNFTLDSFDKYTQNASYNNNSITFDGCKIKIKNTIINVCGLPLVAGAKTFRFNHCTIDWSESTYGNNLLDLGLYSVHLFNCKLLLNSGIVLGQWSQPNVIYTNTNTPIFRLVNCEVQRVFDATGNLFLNYVTNASYVAKVQLVNVTLINCDAKTGGSAGSYKITGVETQYDQLVNVLNMTK